MSVSQFIGQLHPAIVHLPIGILLFTLLLMLLSNSEKFVTLKPAISIGLLIGSISAFLSCITGYLLSESQLDYDKVVVTRHMWAGIATAIISFMLYAKTVNESFAFSKKILTILLLLLIIVTGYLGAVIHPHFQ